ncbi:ABC transporter ATP-binding protein [Corynebacterium aquatimens]|uniref:ABC transport system ATP-binding protein n=1 Tax=Corynebacterium aquatimens TaxID=1190508 RepID=A0A931DVT5_9CORY|nr:ABC transporter ATP-binding protein [Corynebacterium aquatimens]MBG6121112.1 putative ABC transport system ATP-binding protein [Corynebacterium aquatimens]WJY66332.1 Macrolide export ATP-binding/permease protein MacB [Corynebacterium aquatimens]
MNAPLEMIDVSCSFGDGPRRVTALDNVSLTVAPGELVAVMGPSGSGKSTLLNVAGLLQPADSGQVLIDGVEASGLSRGKTAKLRRRHIGLVFQHYNLLSTLTVGENVALPLELDGAKPGDISAQIEAALEEVGLGGLAGRYPDEISGGQAQRVAIARALVGKRKLVLADEPTGALDTATADDVIALLRARVDAGAAAILVTHEPRFAGWADRTVMMRDGKVS